MKSKSKKDLNLTIFDIKIGKKSQNILERNGYVTREDIISNWKKIIKIRGIGNVTIEQLKKGFYIQKNEIETEKLEKITIETKIEDISSISGRTKIILGNMQIITVNELISRTIKERRIVDKKSKLAFEIKSILSNINTEESRRAIKKLEIYSPKR